MEYQELYQQIVDAPPIRRQDLDILKEKYKDDINSKRTFKLIKCLGDLVRVLEKRDVINEDNLEELWFIKSSLGIPNIVGNANAILPTINNNNYRTAQPANSISPEARRRILELLCARFTGPKLRDFARYLDLQETFIDSLDALEPRLQVLKVIKHGEEKFPSDWRVKLVKGLLDVRRKDLMTKVIDILAHF